MNVRGRLPGRFGRPAPLRHRASVSVVIPCYNYGRYLPDAVGSALDQAGLDVEVLIVDDASTDDSAEVALGLARRDPRVDVLLHEENAGHIRTYNDGLAKATGDYVVLLSADDLLARDALTRAVALMQAHPGVGLVYGIARSFEGTAPSQAGRVRGWSVWSGREWLSLATRRGRCFLSSPEAVMRREALAGTDGYDVRLPHSGDFDMWLRTAARWDVGRVDGPVQAFYRVHAANMHLTTFGGWLTDLEERRRTFEILFEERAPELDWVTAMRPAAMRALAREALRHGLRGHLDRVVGPGLDDYRRFAVRTDAAVRRSLLWRLTEWDPVRSRRLPGDGVRRFVTRAAYHLEWRRRRRYGT